MRKFILWIWMRRNEGALAKALLFPLWLASSVVALVARHRRRTLPSKGYRAAVPVISVGNVAVGGTGKTPVTIELARRLTEGRGKRVAILSRGYGRREARRTSDADQMPKVPQGASSDVALGPDGAKALEKSAGGLPPPLVVSDGKSILATALEGGDEPVLMAKALPGVPVLVGPDRAALAKFAQERFKPDVLLLDDGFQHFKLARDLDVVLADGSNPKGNGHVIPRGPLREPFDAIGSAGLAWITRMESAAPGEAEQLAAYLEKATGRSPVFSSTKVSEVTLMDGDGRLDVSAMAGVPVFLASGLGRPDAFLVTVRSLGCQVVGEMRFGDHHAFTARDVDAIRKKAAKAGARFILVTAKDAAKLSLVLAPTASVPSPGRPAAISPEAGGQTSSEPSDDTRAATATDGVACASSSIGADDASKDVAASAPSDSVGEAASPDAAASSEAAPAPSADAGAASKDASEAAPAPSADAGAASKDASADVPVPEADASPRFAVVHIRLQILSGESSLDEALDEALS